MKNEYNLLTVGKDGKSVLVCEGDGPKEFRSEGQANSEGRRLINAGSALRYRILKVVADHN